MKDRFRWLAVSLLLTIGLVTVANAAPPFITHAGYIEYYSDGTWETVVGRYSQSCIDGSWHLTGYMTEYYLEDVRDCFPM